jgi:hypothetical protein
MFRLMVVSSLFFGLAACDDNPPPSHPNGAAGSAAHPGGQPEFVPAPSFDACYPWERGVTEPPTFQLLASGEPVAHLFVMPGYMVFASPEDGWRSGFAEAEFEQLWELSKRARQEYPDGQELAGDDRSYMMSIGCGGFYSWYVMISDSFAETGQGPTAQLAKWLLELMRSPPPEIPPDIPSRAM